MIMTTGCDKDPEYRPLTTFFGEDWPARDSKFLPDFFTFASDRHSQSLHNMHSRCTSGATAVPHDAIDDEFEDTPWGEDEPIDFDGVVFDTEFDRSFLRGLDTQLLLLPIDAFIDLCWTEAVVAEDLKPRSQSNHVYDRSIDYQSDPDLTPNDGRSQEVSFEDIRHLVHFDSFSTASTCSALPTPTDDDSRHGEIPVVFLDGHCPVSNPNDSIHFFPVSPLARHRLRVDRKLSHTRIADFCSNLPLAGRLIKSASAA